MVSKGLIILGFIIAGFFVFFRCSFHIVKTTGREPIPTATVHGAYNSGRITAWKISRKKSNPYGLLKTLSADIYDAELRRKLWIISVMIL